MRMVVEKCDAAVWNSKNQTISWSDEGWSWGWSNKEIGKSRRPQHQPQPQPQHVADRDPFCSFAVSINGDDVRIDVNKRTRPRRLSVVSFHAANNRRCLLIEGYIAIAVLVLVSIVVVNDTMVTSGGEI